MDMDSTIFFIINKISIESRGEQFTKYISEKAQLDL